MQAQVNCPVIQRCFEDEWKKIKAKAVMNLETQKKMHTKCFFFLFFIKEDVSFAVLFPDFPAWTV